MIGRALLWAVLATAPGLSHADEALKGSGGAGARTGHSAYTLDDGEMSVGLWRLQYGITDRWQVGTHNLLWLVGPNATVKWHAWQSGPWSVAAQVGVTSVDMTKLGVEDEDARITAVPMKLVGTYERGDWGYNLALNVTQITGSGEQTISTSEDGEDQSLDGLATVDTTSLTPAVEWRVGEHLALVFEANIMLAQNVAADANTTFRIDDQTTVEVFGGADAEDDSEGFKGNWSVSLFWSWDTFNLKLGGGSGNYHFPPLYVFLPQKTFTPQLEMFWRF